MKKTITQHTVLIFNPGLAKEIGLHRAIVLQQLYYWQSKYGEDRWIYNSYEQWHARFGGCFSVTTIRRIFQFLIDGGIIECKRSQSCNAYRICTDALKCKLFDQNKKYPSKGASTNNQFDHLQMRKMITSNTRDDQNNQAQVIRMSNTCSKTTAKTTDPYSSYSSPSLGKRGGGDEIDYKKKTEQTRTEQTRTKEPETLKELIHIWEAHIPVKGDGIELTDARRTKILLVFAKHFKSSVEGWYEFVLHITKSKFLMGKNARTDFCISLDWVMKDETTLKKVLNGKYHDPKELERVLEGKRNTKPLSDLKNNSSLDLRWGNTLQDAICRFGEDTYISWFSKLNFISSRDDILTLEVSSDFVKEEIETHYSRKLLCIAESHFEELRKICFVVPDKAQTERMQFKRYTQPINEVGHE